MVGSRPPALGRMTAVAATSIGDGVTAAPATAVAGAVGPVALAAAADVVTADEPDVLADVPDGVDVGGLI
jgi:hypothetical protein